MEKEFGGTRPVNVKSKFLETHAMLSKVLLLCSSILEMS